MTAADACTACGARYADLRLGLTFAAVRRELRAEPERRRVTRHTVLGRMREIKLMHWHAWHGPGRCAPDLDTPTATPTVEWP